MGISTLLAIGITLFLWRPQDLLPVLESILKLVPWVVNHKDLAQSIYHELTALPLSRLMTHIMHIGWFLFLIKATRETYNVYQKSKREALFVAAALLVLFLFYKWKGLTFLVTVIAFITRVDASYMLAATLDNSNSYFIFIVLHPGLYPYIFMCLYLFLALTTMIVKFPRQYILFKHDPSAFSHFLEGKYQSKV